MLKTSRSPLSILGTNTWCVPEQCGALFVGVPPILPASNVMLLLWPACDQSIDININHLRQAQIKRAHMISEILQIRVVICSIFLRLLCMKKGLLHISKGWRKLFFLEGRLTGACSTWSTCESREGSAHAQHVSCQHVSLLFILYTIRDASGPDLSISVFFSSVWLWSLFLHISCCGSGVQTS